MELVMNVWLAFNTVFGLFTAKNLIVRVCTFFNRGKYHQNDLGKFLDMVVLTSILAYYLSV